MYAAGDRLVVLSPTQAAVVLLIAVAFAALAYAVGIAEGRRREQLDPSKDDR